MHIKIKYDHKRDKNNESSQSQEQTSKPQTTTGEKDKRNATADSSFMSKAILCAATAQHHTCTHHVLRALDHIRIGSVSLQRAFVLESKEM